MSQAEDLLNSLEDEAAVYSVDPATEPHIIINRDRTVTVPEELKHIAVQGDHNIETVTFDCPRYWDNHDLSKMRMRIVFQRPDGHREPHLVENLKVDDSDTSMIHFEWTISGNVTLVKGTISFMVCAKITNSEGISEREWHTRLNQDLVIDEGMDCSGEEIVEQNPDIIEEILYRLEIAEQGGVVEDNVINITWESNAFVRHDNGFVDRTSSAYSVTDPIDVSNVSLVKIRVECHGNAGVVLYDAQGKRIDGFLPDMKVLQTVDVSDAATIRVSCTTSYLPNAIVELESADDVKDRALTNWYDTLGERMAHLLNKATEKKICCIVDDDTVSIAAVQLFQTACNANGIKGTLACLTKNLERNTGLDETLLGMERDGYQIVLHAHTQTGAQDETDFWRDPDAALAKCEADMVQGLQNMKEAGFSNYRYWVTPYCKDTDSVQRMARKWGMKCLLAGGNTYEPADDTYGRYAIRRAAFGHNDADSSITLAQLQTIAQEAAANNGWLVVMTHFEQWQKAGGGSGTVKLTPTWINGKYIMYTSGTEMDSDLYSVTDFIDVSEYSTVNVLTKVAGTTAGLCLYDSSKNYLDGSQPSNEVTPIDVSNASYIRVSCWTTSGNFTLDDVSIEGVNNSGGYTRFTKLIDYLKGLGYEFMTVGEAWSYRKAIYDVYDML